MAVISIAEAREKRKQAGRTDPSGKPSLANQSTEETESQDTQEVGGVEALRAQIEENRKKKEELKKRQSKQNKKLVHDMKKEKGSL